MSIETQSLHPDAPANPQFTLSGQCVMSLLQLSLPLSLSLCRVLRPPGGGSNISFGADEEKPPVRKNKMASSVFAEPEDPYANRRNNPPGIVGNRYTKLI